MYQYGNITLSLIELQGRNWNAAMQFFDAATKPWRKVEKITAPSGLVVRLGEVGSYSRTIRSTDTEKFSDISGDKNPVHLDPEFARTTRFKECIAHGMHSMTFLSTAIAETWKGAILLNVNVDFARPVKIGSKVDATITTIQLFEEKHPRALLHAVCKVDGKNVIEGDILVMFQ